MTLIECVPNFSEGRRPEVVDQIVDAMGAVEGVEVLDRQSDLAHNRSVITFVAQEGAAAEAAFRGVAAAARLIDLNRHEGAHPRFGAADVVPFVPLKQNDMPVCVATARSLAARVARELAIPAYLYEEAALRSDHRNLADVRGAGFEELREVIASDPARRPDEGQAMVHPTAGAVAIGARAPLIAFNVNLASGDVELARRIADAIRERDGGLPRVKAIGLALDDGRAQVSMNLTDYRVTSPRAALDAVRTRAETAGVSVSETEVVGLLPQEVLVELSRDVLQADDFGRAQVLEARVLDLLLS